MNWRYRFIFFLFSLAFLVVVVRLFYWQVVKAQELFLLAKSQYSGVVKILPKQGEIKTSDQFPLASSKVSYLVFANPKLIKDKKKTASIVASILRVDTASISAKLRFNRLWVSLNQNIDTRIKETLENLKLPGIGFEQQYTRFYPEASMAAHLLGFVGKDEAGQSKGYFGVEGYYDRLLRGKEGYDVSVHDALGRPILGRMSDSASRLDGSTLVLAIDRSIQFMIEEKLKEGVELYGASGGMVGVMNPKTGEMLAMAALPSFDPENYVEYDENLYKNPFISNSFEPGSTFKPIVMSSAIESGLVTPLTKCPICGGPVFLGGYEIRTWNNKYVKDSNMIDVIRRSDNTGMIYVASKLGLDRMLSYLRRFGIGALTRIDSQGETLIPLKPKGSWYPVDLATTGFGQGISVTPIGLLHAFSAIANGGKRMWPHFVSHVETPEGKVIGIDPKVMGNPISEKTAKIMTEMLVNAVEKGEASWARLKGYRIAGKTGTASIPLKGKYDTTKTITSFIGFAPADDPKFVMLVILDKPTTSIYGSETAAPIFFDIAKNILTYFNIPPSE